MRGHLNGRAAWRYVIALGSNRRHGRFGSPPAVLAAALRSLVEQGVSVLARAPVLVTDPVGPSLRRYANSAALVETTLPPPALLELLKDIERAFGRRSNGQRWTSRVLDLDIVLWDGGAFAEPGLTIPHALFRERQFVLGPALRVAAAWRDPVSGLTVRQLHARLTRRRSVRR